MLSATMDFALAPVPLLSELHCNYGMEEERAAIAPYH